MQAFEDGNSIDISSDNVDWEPDVNPLWNWCACHYRVRPEEKPKTQLEEIEANWPFGRVELLVRDESGDLTVQNGSYHVHCPSMEGFDGYVYKDKYGYFERDMPTRKTGHIRLFPVAVLFEK